MPTSPVILENLGNSPKENERNSLTRHFSYVVVGFWESGASVTSLGGVQPSINEKEVMVYVLPFFECSM